LPSHQVRPRVAAPSRCLPDAARFAVALELDASFLSKTLIVRPCQPEAAGESGSCRAACRVLSAARRPRICSRMYVRRSHLSEIYRHFIDLTRFSIRGRLMQKAIIVGALAIVLVATPHCAHSFVFLSLPNVVLFPGRSKHEDATVMLLKKVDTFHHKFHVMPATAATFADCGGFLRARKPWPWS